MIIACHASHDFWKKCRLIRCCKAALPKYHGQRGGKHPFLADIGSVSGGGDQVETRYKTCSVPKRSINYRREARMGIPLSRRRLQRHFKPIYSFAASSWIKVRINQCALSNASTGLRTKGLPAAECVRTFATQIPPQCLEEMAGILGCGPARRIQDSLCRIKEFCRIVGARLDALKSPKWNPRLEIASVTADGMADVDGEVGHTPVSL